MCPNDFSADIHQNLYVSDGRNSSVQVFTKDGVHFRSIGRDKGCMKNPNSIHVHGQYVYVTDIAGHCVFVFTNDGEYITSFGQKGQKKKRGNFNLPVYVHVDKDGFVYISDLNNHRLQCF